MCTAISFSAGDRYFGRTLDYECTYGERAVFVPRNFPLSFRAAGALKRHLAIYGTAHLAGNYPLFYEAANEKGLALAGLNFPAYARYLPPQEGKIDLAPYEFTLHLLGTCETLEEARSLLGKVNFAAIPFGENYPLSPLHYLLSDGKESLVIEPREDGLHIFENPTGALTNSPPFDYHLLRLADHMQVTSRLAENRFSERLPISPYSRGMGGMGLPGDLSSVSRFVRAVFTKENAHIYGTEAEDVGQFFHILGAVEQVDGCAQVEHGYEKTVYTSCYNCDKLHYFYTTYGNRRITEIDWSGADREGRELLSYPLLEREDILKQNG